MFKILAIILSIFTVKTISFIKTKSYLPKGSLIGTHSFVGLRSSTTVTTFENYIEPAIDAVVDAIKSANNLEERRPLKTALLALSARTNRGQIATSEEKNKALELVRKLESFNPTEDPALDELSLGRWELVFSNTQLFRSSPFFMAARAVCKDGQETDSFNQFCDLHREALMFTQIGKVTQIITTDKLVSEFVSIVAALPGFPLTVTGTIVSSSDIISKSSDSYELYMDKVQIKDSSLPGPFGEFFNNFEGLPIRALGERLEEQSGPRPRPIFRTLYIDTHMKISRDQDDNFFVYNRV
jgi:hypothetical protein|mmetsp:Transcript_6030/g.6163  ORF Transcript_6030/g.6163 Transcript_6030/m.6163 type:complete len:298 (+) Transcript_6030:154-1047(+)